MITLKILLFSILKEKVGQDTIELKVASSLTGEQLLDKLSSDYDSIHSFRSVIRLAVNESYVHESIELTNGDEVALITPVSGG